MFEFDHTKEYGLPFSDCLRKQRISRYPLQVDENIIVYDRLENEGTIRLYDYLGGVFYTPMDSYEMDHCKNAVLVAEIAISIREEEKEIHVDRLFCEYGYDFEHVLFRQVLALANLFNFRVSILNLKKLKNQCCFMGSKSPVYL